MPVTPRKLLDLVTDALDDGKAEDIKAFDVAALTSIADFMVIATGRSSRQVKALAERVADAARKKQVKPLGIEGEQTSEWVLVDLGDVIVHVMQPETRAFYQLEKLWDSAPAPRSRPAAKAVAEKPAAPGAKAAASARAASNAPAKARAVATGATRPRKAASTVSAVVAKPVVRKPRKSPSAAAGATATVAVAKPVVRKPRKSAAAATAPAKAAAPRRARAKPATKS